MNIEEKIKLLITNSISSYLNGDLVFASQVLDHIFPRERRIRSIIGGLETSLGTKLWENLAKLLASENGFEVLDEMEFNKIWKVYPIREWDNIQYANRRPPSSNPNRAWWKDEETYLDIEISEE